MIFGNSEKHIVPIELAKAENKPTSKVFNVPHHEIFAIKGSIIPGLLLPCAVVTLWSALISVLFIIAKISWVSFPNDFNTIFSTVLGLLLVFRNNAAYDRHWEGRKVWGLMFTHARNLGRMFTVTVKRPQTVKNIKDLHGVLNLLLAFGVAAKHRLRDEPGYYYEDLYYLLVHLPEYAPGCVHPQPVNLPLEIGMHISSYIDKCKRAGWVDPPTAGAMQTTMMGINDCLSSMERIAHTPVPVAYLIHLKQITFIYLIALAPQMVAKMLWGTIPVVCLSSFIFFGILAIGDEIEQPFGYDANDLAVDQFCTTIREELSFMLERCKSMNPDSWTDPVDLNDMNFYVDVECSEKDVEAK